MKLRNQSPVQESVTETENDNVEQVVPVSQSQVRTRQRQEGVQDTQESKRKKILANSKAQSP